MGNLDQTFVERRRQMLEDYLRALLKLPEVILDDLLWEFLDADRETVAVPRFLCRGQTPEDAARCLVPLLEVAKNQADIFRLCNARVTQELTAFVLAEAEEALPLAAAGQTLLPSVVQTAQVRLENRIRVCAVLLPLINDERARAGLVEAGMFNALLTLLCRTTEDCEAASSATSSGLVAAEDLHSRVSFAAKTCLQELIEGSKGEALLKFCQRDGGLDGLQRLASTVRLHAVTTSLLWHGLQHGGVVTALAGPPASGQNILWKLLKSTDLKAKVLAGLCWGCVLRLDTTMQEEKRQVILELIGEIPKELDEEEARAMLRGVQAALDRGPPLPEEPSVAGSVSKGGTFTTNPASLPPSPSWSLSSCGKGSTARPTGRCTSTLAGKIQATPERDPALVALMRSLCSPKVLGRLQALLAGSDEPGDVLGALVVSVLDHFTQQSAEEPERLKELAPLVPQLKRIVDERDEAGIAVSSHDPHDLQADEVRVRAARVLVRLPGGNAEATQVPTSREPASLQVCCHRAKVLEVLTRDSERCQAKQAESLRIAKDRGNQQTHLVQSGDLDKEPCIEQARLAEFGTYLQQLCEQRRALGREVESASRAAEVIRSNLDQRAMNHGMFKEEVFRLERDIEAQAEQEGRSHEAEACVRECEVEYEELQRKADFTQCQLREAEVAASRTADAKREAEFLMARLDAKQAELWEVCVCAPTQVRILEEQVASAHQRLEKVREDMRQFAEEAERAERKAATLREREREAENGLRSLARVTSELQALKETIHSEIVPTPEEVVKLKQLEVLLQPARPSRLRRTHDAGGSQDSLSAAVPEEVDAPVWDADIKAEKEFRESPHFRSLCALRDSRAKLWGDERRWLQDVAGRADAIVGEIALKRRDKEKTERAIQDEEERLRKDILDLADYQGHSERHANAREEAAEALRRKNEAADAASEAARHQKAVEACLMQEQAAALEAREALARAREAADEQAEECLRVRADLEKRCLDLEAEARAQLQGLRALEMQETRLGLLQARVARSIGEEEEGRRQLRLEVHRLIDDLQRLDQQLDAQDVPMRYDEDVGTLV